MLLLCREYCVGIHFAATSASHFLVVLYSRLALYYYLLSHSFFCCFCSVYVAWQDAGAMQGDGAEMWRRDVVQGVQCRVWHNC